MMENKGTRSLSGAELSDSVTINKWCKIISFHPNISSPVNDLLNTIPIDQTVSANNSYLQIFTQIVANILSHLSFTCQRYYFTNLHLSTILIVYYGLDFHPLGQLPRLECRKYMNICKVCKILKLKKKKKKRNKFMGLSQVSHTTPYSRWTVACVRKTVLDIMC